MYFLFSYQHTVYRNNLQFTFILHVLLAFQKCFTCKIYLYRREREQLEKERLENQRLERLRLEQLERERLEREKEERRRLEQLR